MTGTLLLIATVCALLILRMVLFTDPASASGVLIVIAGCALIAALVAAIIAAAGEGSR